MSNHRDSPYSTGHGHSRVEGKGNTQKAATWPQWPEQRHQVPVRTPQAATIAAGTGAGGGFQQPLAGNIQYPPYPYQQSRRSSGSESVSSYDTFHGSAVPTDLRASGAPAPRSPEEMARAGRVQQEQKERARYTAEFTPSFTTGAHRGHVTMEAVAAVDKLFSGPSVQAPTDSTSEIFEELDGITAAQYGGYNA